MKVRITFGLLALALVAIVLAGCIQPSGPLARFTTTPKFDYPPFEPTFDASASSSPNGAIVSYAWDFGDGKKGSGAVVTHLYEEKGVYEVTLVVTDSSGKTGARIEAVEALNKAPTARFTFSPYWVYALVEATFDASESSDQDGEIVQYLWSFGDGTSDEGMIVEHAFPFSTSGGGWQPTVTLTVVDDSGKTSTTSKTINVQGCSSCSG
ncbi:PKD domain-containing protein [Candidatus Bipolaricaulota bacterium]|nr:PKD domain-containing protein [Candidatus Bipolaricaulota bacterium]